MCFWKFQNSESLVTQNLSYTDLANKIFLLSKELKFLGKHLVFLLGDNSEESLIKYLYCLQSGHVPLLLSHTIEPSLLDNLINTYAPDIIFTIGKKRIDDIKYRFEGYDNSIINFYIRKAEKSPNLNTDLAVLLSTSGTTGSPKLVKLSYNNLHSNAKSIVQYLSLTNKEIAITSLPMYYSYGLSIINSHLLAKAKIITTNDSILSREFWDLFTHYKCTSFAGVPASYDMIKSLRLFENLDLTSLNYCTQAGGRLSIDLIRYFYDLLKSRDKRFYVMYGATEATARISYVPPEQLANKIGSIGIPIPRGQLELVDLKNSNDFITEPDKEGELVYTGPNVMMGYANNKVDLEVGNLLKNKLFTGDIAKRDLDGYFYITGRLKRFIKLFGLRINLEEIERNIELEFKCRIACGQRDDQLVIFIERCESILTSPIQFNNEDIREFLSKKYSININYIKVVFLDKLPLTSSNKIDYTKLTTYGN